MIPKKTSVCKGKCSSRSGRRGGGAAAAGAVVVVLVTGGSGSGWRIGRLLVLEVMAVVVASYTLHQQQ